MPADNSVIPYHRSSDYLHATLTDVDNPINSCRYQNVTVGEMTQNSPVTLRDKIKKSRQKSISITRHRRGILNFNSVM